MKDDNSQKLFNEARKVIPGGVNSPVRACRSVGMDPVFITRGQGARLWDEDGQSYIDYVGSWGPLILGHAHPAVIAALETAISQGTSFGAPTGTEVKLAELLVECVPSLEMVRLVNSGTEATMTAVRLARGVTGRSYIIKFDGCYHGHADSLLVAAGSGVATLGIPGSPGVPEVLARLTISLPYNNLKPVKEAFQSFEGQIAAIIVEPVAGNMGVVLPQEEFLPGCAELARENGALFILDEVITGFRLGLNGAQGRFGLDPDLTCLGKIIGGGLPVGALGGKKDVMSHLAPEGSVYQAGTLAGNPLAVAAGLATIETLKADPSIYDRIEKLSQTLAEGLLKEAKKAGLAVTGHQIGSMSCLFFNPGPVTDYASAANSNLDMFACFYKAFREAGIYLAPSQFETTFVSAAHTESDIEKTLAAAPAVFKNLT
ncbi:MAG: glutamate-1-semialdehyde 2,1-aminomutase [Deltaproteobacteria bacterium]|nr:glutamate-1-semialdehyde 2,1-aminomutase [Deltaproteobacteria bacterium]MBW2053173.1 glutamate-1-semialdehyde 2,1-aminomutase [Deltaproteobacteria bacterium]MBW2141125.1 glutamate-1-semialdehyde 2,1-aminomutase [Deltaproteobacteria bacterium]MBW2324197.1 glutamate-1-semialdehyde 2,1-aminomutase [Deltaproteobacteria bacterium]